MRRGGSAVVLAAVVVAMTSACGGSRHPAPTSLRLPFALGSLSAQGTRVAAAPAGHDPQLGAGQRSHAIIWNASTRRLAALELPHTCADPSTTVLAGAQVAVLCDDSCCGGIDERVVLVRPGAGPVSVMHVTSGIRVPGGRIDGLAGGGHAIVFTRDSVDVRGRTESQALYRIDGTHAAMVTETNGARIGRPLAIARDLILVEKSLKPPHGIQLSTPPSELRVLRTEDAVQVASAPNQYEVPAGVPEPRLLFDGRTVYGVDFFSDELSGSRTSEASYDTHFCVVGPGVTLGGVSGRFIAYTTADAVHVVRMTDCRDALIAVGHGVPVASAITPKGLFYAFNARPTLGLSGADLARVHSTLAFVPMARVVAAVQKGLNLRSGIR